MQKYSCGKFSWSRALVKSVAAFTNYNKLHEYLTPLCTILIYSLANKFYHKNRCVKVWRWQNSVTPVIFVNRRRLTCSTEFILHVAKQTKPMNTYIQLTFFRKANQWILISLLANYVGFKHSVTKSRLDYTNTKKCLSS